VGVPGSGRIVSRDAVRVAAGTPSGREENRGKGIPVFVGAGQWVWYLAETSGQLISGASGGS
jgi:hypothetical protein